MTVMRPCARFAPLVRERLVAGDSDEEVLDFVVERYGEFALLQPKFGAAIWSCGSRGRWACCSRFHWFEHDASILDQSRNERRVEHG